MNFIERFLATAAQHEGLAAVEAGDTSITYGELASRAAALAAHLRDRGAGPERLVGLRLGKSIEHVIAVLGTWMAGAAFVPLDPALPEERLRWMLADCQPALVLGVLPPAGRPMQPVHGNLAYCIYTSGSTGVPKGVLIEQRNLVPLFEAQRDAFQLGPGSRALFYVSPSFDASLSDLGTALLSGATLVLPPREGLHGAALLATIGELRITTADLPPSIVRGLDDTMAPPALRTLVIGGEPCAPEAVRRWSRRARVVNVYGPTEATICASLCLCDERWERPLLGRPVAGARFRVQGGELLIGGPGLARGYLGRPELTAERFIEQGGDRWYRSGDLVRELPGGDLEFLGRLDRQFKIRGVRIEPEEIEAQLARFPPARATAVVLRGEELVAFVEPADVPLAELRAHAAQALPPSLVPNRLVALDALPRTPSGKVDLPRLMTLPLSPLADDTRAPTPAEAALCRLFATTLGLARVGPHADFFALGGTSLEALQLAALAEAEGVPLPVGDLVRWPTPAALALRSAPGPSAADLRADAESLVPSPGLETSAAPPRILLTGATGFLGSRLLAGLPKPVLFLSRTQGELRGDLALPRWGLTADRWNQLAREIDCIVHCGAEVNLIKSYAQLRDTNVCGTAEALRLAAEGAPKRFHHISTLSVFVATERNAGLLLEDDDLSQTREVHGGYAQSKFAAEHLVRVARPSAAIYRLGLVTPDSRTGQGRRTDLLALFVRGLVALGCIPEGANLALALDVTPVDYAAAALAHCIRGGVQGQTLHLANERSLPLATLLEELPVPIARVTEARFLERLREVEGADSSAAALALCRGLSGGAFARQRTFDLFQATGARFSLARSAAALRGSGLSCPAPTRELLRLYLREILREEAA